jgi:hypothetical protein
VKCVDVTLQRLNGLAAAGPDGRLMCWCSRNCGFLPPRRMNKSPVTLPNVATTRLRARQAPAARRAQHGAGPVVCPVVCSRGSGEAAKRRCQSGPSIGTWSGAVRVRRAPGTAANTDLPGSGSLRSTNKQLLFCGASSTPTHQSPQCRVPKQQLLQRQKCMLKQMVGFDPCWREATPETLIGLTGPP